MCLTSFVSHCACLECYFLLKLCGRLSELSSNTFKVTSTSLFMNHPAVSSYLTFLPLSLSHSLFPPLSSTHMQSLKHHGNLLGGIGCQETGFAPYCMLTKVGWWWRGYNQQDWGELEASGTGTPQSWVCWRGGG